MKIKEKIQNKLRDFLGIKKAADESYSWLLPFFTGGFDGENEASCYDDILSNIFDVDYYELGRRAYTLVTINEFARIAISRLTQFAIGTGLKLHPEPCIRFLKRKFGINLDKEFSKDIQELWSLFENDKNISITKQDNLHSLANKVFFNAFIAGDVLVIKRVENNNLTYQLVNGLSVYTSMTLSESGNKIKDGVEIDENGKHIAYYVKQSDGSEKRIKAYDAKGRPIAWLVYASDNRLNCVRGYSPLGAIMQKMRKIGQYANSEVIAAETNAKFAAVIEQDKDSNGTNALKNLPGLPRGYQSQNTQTKDDRPNLEARKFTEKIKRITNGIFFQLPKGQKMNSFDTKRPNINYTAFLDGSMKYMYASLGIPFEIAILLFSNNFSASRAALKMFELIIEYLRKFTIIDRFYQIIYEQFFELESLKGNIYAPKYLNLKNDYGYMDNAYTKAKFIGKKIPHIDEVKEVNAIIAKLKAGLITFEQALESLGNNVDFDTLITVRKNEENSIKKAGLFFESIFAPDGVYKDEKRKNEDSDE